MTVTARVGSDTPGLHYDLHKFEVIRKEKEGKAFPLTSARVMLACGKNTWKIKMPGFHDEQETDND